MKKTLWPIFSRSMECDKPPGKICRGPEGILVITVEPIRVFSGPKRLLKTQIFEKNGKLSNDKNIVAYFFS